MAQAPKNRTLTMCGGVTNKTTRGERLAPITPWEIWWKWIKAKAVSVTRPDRNTQES